MPRTVAEITIVWIVAVEAVARTPFTAPDMFVLWCASIIRLEKGEVGMWLTAWAILIEVQR